MMSFTNPDNSTQTGLEIDLTKPMAEVEIETKEEVTKEIPKWDGRGIRLEDREDFINYVNGRVRSELAREVLNHTKGNKVSEKDVDAVLAKNFSFVTKNIPKEENFPVTINPGFHNSSFVYAGDRTPFHRGDRFLASIKSVARDILFLLEATETGAFEVVELEEGKGTIETFFIYSTKGENLPLVTEKPKKEPKPKTALEAALNEVGIKKSPAPRKEPKESKEAKASKQPKGIRPTVTIKGNEVIVRIPEGYSVVVETV